MGSIRAFVAIYPSPDELSRCLRLRDAEKALWPSARWVRDDQIHLTLRFFEALEEARLRELIRWLAEAALETCPFRIRLFHRVPPWRGAKVEAISAESPDLDLLARRVEEAARRAGAPPERRPFRGHVTLARHDGRWPEQRLPSFEDEWHARAFRLVRSELGRAGATHTVLEEFALGG